MRIDRTIRSNEQHHFIFRGFSCHTCLVTHFIEQELLHYNAFIGRTAISIGYLPHQCPLQAKGIRVHLSILGDHTAAGMRSLSKDAARAFAKDLKAYIDIYGFDGIDFDDEYSTYATDQAVEPYIPSDTGVSFSFDLTSKAMKRPTILKRGLPIHFRWRSFRCQ